MLSAPQMHLEPVRTVLTNEACEVTVCRGTLSPGQPSALYTLVAILQKPLGKQVAGMVATEGLFAHCADFVGSFVQKEQFTLVFRYHHERRLTSSQQVYAADFAQRKQLAVAFLAALAEVGVDGAVGTLLIDERNLNIEGERVYLNYFLDFSRMPQTDGEVRFYNDAALFSFTLLSWDFAQKHDGDAEAYPHELRLMQKKAQRENFRSFSQILAFIRQLPNKPTPRRGGAGRLLDTLGRARRYVTANASRTFLVVLVLVTLIFLGYQLFIRLHSYVSSRQNSVYVGMAYIGEEYLGEEYI